MSGSNSSSVNSGGPVGSMYGFSPIGDLFREAFTKMRVFEGGSQIDPNPQFTYAPPPTNQDLFPYIVQALQNARLQGLINQSPTYSFGAARFLGPQQVGANRFLVGQEAPQLIYTAPTTDTPAAK